MEKVEKKVSKKKSGRVSKVKSTPKKNKKIEEKRKKELTLVPRLRLEPRLTPTPSKKNDDQIIDIEKDKRLTVLLNANEVSSYFNQPNAVSPGNSHSENDCNRRHEVADILNTAPTPKSIYETALDGIQSSVQMNDNDSEFFMKHRKRLVRKGICWNDRELKDLAYGFQSQGFADLKKVADIVKTKNENDIREYIKPRCWEARKDNNPDSEKQRGRPPNKWTTVSRENLATWPNVRKWRRLAYEQMLLYTRTKDYSKPVIQSLCKQFYEEEPEPSDPQVINTKLIYKYMMDCVAGKIPPQLPPKESALVLDMLREVRSMPIAYDFEEERKFLEEFRTATNFKPFQVKDEFKKRVKKDIDNEACGSNTVSVPEEVFLDLSRHKRLVQSFNPLVTPVWMLQKEQEYLRKYCEESNVYVE